jgi:hypothetical protein
MEKEARSEGYTLVEWMRETLLGALENNSNVSKALPVRMAGGRAPAHERALGVAKELDEASNPEAPSHHLSGTCEHRKRRGELCYKCDSKFGRPEIKET